MADDESSSKRASGLRVVALTAGPVSVWSLAAELGEGPVWAIGALWFVDIKKQAIHRFDPVTESRDSWAAPQQIGFLLPTRSGSFIAGLQSGLHRFDQGTGAFTLIEQVDAHLPGNRLNDGVVDPAGRLWFGTMDNGERARSGSFYCFADGKVRHTGLSRIAITNGPAVSPDGQILYWVDTIGGTISACDIGEDGALGPSRRFAKIDPSEGYPDGPTIDSEGCLWISLYAGGEVRRYAPDGDLVERVKFPVANITKIAFGGDDLMTAYATTARQKLSPEEIAPQPQIGDLFAFRVKVPGLPCPLVAD